MPIHVKRIYDPPADSDGRRVLVDRIWPRGMSKEKARVDYWAKDCAPSTQLRKWYGHEPDKWPEFQRRYFAELDENPSAINALQEAANSGTVTLLFSSRETELNNAAALKAYLQDKGLL